MKKYRILIVRPYVNHGGPIVLSTLCKYLIERGYNAKLLYIHVGPKKHTNMLLFWVIYIKNILKYIFMSLCIRLFGRFDWQFIQVFKDFCVDPVPGTKRKLLPFYNRKNTIVVYPEGIYGNFLHAKNVIRYLLYHYRYENDTRAYGKNDLFICFRNFFNSWKLNSEGLCVTFNYFDRALYRQYNFGERKGNCYIIRKGKNRTDLPECFDGPILDSLREEDKVKIFNSKKFCLVYDPQTFYCLIAAICGCIPIVIMEPGKTKEDYKTKNETSYGRAYGDSPDEIEYAITTRRKLIDALDNIESNNNINIDKFIQIMNKKFE